MSKHKGKPKCAHADDTLLEHIQQMITTAVDDLRLSIISCLHESESKLLEEMKKLTDRCDVLDQKIHDQKQITDDLALKIDQIESKVKESIILGNHNDQYSRRWSIKFHGIPETKDEECIQRVVNFVNIELKMSPPLTPPEIEVAHRTGPLKRDNTKSRPIIARFFNRNRRFEVLKQRFNLKNTSFLMTDDITRNNITLLNRLRNHPKVDSAWFTNGKVKAKEVTTKKIKIFDIYDDIDTVFKS